MPDKIPRRIVQVWGQGESHLPLLLRACHVNVRLLNPDYEICFFDDRRIREFVDEHFPEYARVLDSFRLPIQKYDFFRYLAIYQLGGFYLDLDVLLVSSLENLREHECIFAFEELTLNSYLRRTLNVDWEIANYAFGSVPGHPFLKALIGNCVRAQAHEKWVSPMTRAIPKMFRQDFFAFCSSGPAMVTRTLWEKPEQRSGVSVLFPPDVRDRTHWHCLGDLGVHLQQGAWLAQNRPLHRKLLRIWVSWKRKKFFAESERLGPRRTMRNS